jgi:hypothetical protein
MPGLFCLENSLYLIRGLMGSDAGGFIEIDDNVHFREKTGLMEINPKNAFQQKIYSGVHGEKSLFAPPL